VRAAAIVLAALLAGCASGGRLPVQRTEYGLERVRTSEMIVWEPRATRFCQTGNIVGDCK
jgi:hypothetical protein